MCNEDDDDDDDEHEDEDDDDDDDVDVSEVRSAVLVEAFELLGLGRIMMGMEPRFFNDGNV
jgi:hypothetical protein